MKKRVLFIVLALVVILFVSRVSVSLIGNMSAVEPEVKMEPIYQLPETERVLFYRDGTTVYEAKIPPSAIIDKSFILPDQIDINSFTIQKDGNRIFSYSMEQAALMVQLLEDDPDNPGSPLVARIEAQLITVPEIGPNSTLDVKFGIGRSGISWNLILDMEAAGDNKLNCNLLASIETIKYLAGNLKYILAKRPEIILLSSSNIFIEGSDAVFNVGNPLLEPGKTTFMKLEEGQSTYRQVYVWDAENKEHPDAYLYCSNPFVSTINRVQGNLNSNGLNINTFSSLRLIPGRQFELLVGEQPLINTFKSVLTREFPEKEYPNRTNLPFTHTLEYRATNNLGVTAELEISVPVTYGKIHRTVYTFRRQPDERPGDRMIWKYRLAPNANANLEFSFDAEKKDNSRYSDYDYYSGGR